MERAGRKAGSGIKKNRHRGMYVLRCYLMESVDIGIDISQDSVILLKIMCFFGRKL